MAYSLPNAAIIEVSVRSLYYGETILNVGHYRFDQLTSVSDGKAEIQAFLALFDPAGQDGASKLLAAATVEAFQIKEVVGQLIYPNRFARIVHQPEAALGEIVGIGVPSNVAIVATKRSDNAGRGGHGSLHMTGASVDSLGNNRWSQAAVDAFDAYAQWWQDTFVTQHGNFENIIYNRKFPAQSPSVITTSTSDEPRTMRRRGVRLGI